MTYMLDTNICICTIRKKPRSVFGALRKLSPDSVAISAITEAELRFCMSNSNRPEHNHRVLDEFLGPFQVPSFDGAAAIHYGDIRLQLKRIGTPHRKHGPSDRRTRQEPVCSFGHQQREGVRKGPWAEMGELALMFGTAGGTHGACGALPGRRLSSWLYASAEKQPTGWASIVPRSVSPFGGIPSSRVGRKEAAFRG